MNNDLISREALKEAVNNNFDNLQAYFPKDFIEEIDNAPTVESERPQGKFSRKDLESWLYQIAMNNIGTDFETSVVEIIHRLDGFERFVSEQKGGAERTP